MELVGSRASLLAAFQVVSAIVPSRTPRELLKNVKLQLSGTDAVLMATDGDGISIRYGLSGVEVRGSGETLLPTVRVISILREISDGQVLFDITGDAILVKSGQSEFRLSAESAADFPPIPGFEDTEFHVLPADMLRKLIRRTLFATDMESTRYALGGVLLELGENEVRMAATDSRRLALAVVAGSSGSAPSGNAQPVIPAKALTLLERSLSDDVKEVHLAVHANDVVVRTGSAVITSQLVQGRFPDYKKVIPSTYQRTVDLVVGPFHSAVRQAQVVTNDESRGVEFLFTDSVLQLASKAADVGQSKIEVPISHSGSGDLKIILDARFVAEFLKALEPETSVHFNLIDGDSPAVLTTDDGYTYVVMPLAR